MTSGGDARENNEVVSEPGGGNGKKSNPVPLDDQPVGDPSVVHRIASNECTPLIVLGWRTCIMARLKGLFKKRRLFTKGIVWAARKNLRQCRFLSTSGVERELARGGRRPRRFQGSPGRQRGLFWVGGAMHWKTSGSSKEPMEVLTR